MTDAAKDGKPEPQDLTNRIAYRIGQHTALGHLDTADLLEDCLKRIDTLTASLAAEKKRADEGRRETPPHHGLDTDTHVYFYEHDFYVLSNFSAFMLEFKDLHFDTSEAAYHYQKFPATGHDDERWKARGAIRRARSAHDAFKVAETFKAYRRPDWDAVKFDIMRDILRAKAQQHEYVRLKLLATGDRILVEDSWRDDVWGWGPNRDGQNMLGKLWMEVRAELRIAQLEGQ